MNEEIHGEGQESATAEVTSKEKTVSSQLIAILESMSDPPQPQSHIQQSGSNSDEVRATEESSQQTDIDGNMEESIEEVSTAQIDGPVGGNNRRIARPRRQQHEQFRGQDRVDAEAGPSLIDHLIDLKLIPEKRYVRFDDFHDLENLPSKFSKLDAEHRLTEKLNDPDIMELMWFRPVLRKQFQVAFDSAGQLCRRY